MLSKEFLKSEKCPSEFAGLAISYYSKIVAGFSLLDDAEYVEEFEDIPEEIEEKEEIDQTKTE